MKDFEAQLLALCLDRCRAALGDPAASAEVTHVIAAALAASIAALTLGNAGSAHIATEVSIEALPGMVARRLHLFRPPTAPTTGGAQ